MKILHVVPDLAENSGVAVVARGFAREQIASGHDARLGTAFAGADYSAADVVFVHCAWSLAVQKGCLATVRTSRRPFLVRMPHGSYDPVRLAFHGWKKRIVGPVERWGLRAADLVVATCDAEAGWIRAYEPCARRVETVSPGVDLPSDVPVSHSEGFGRKLLYLGRAHPLKGLGMLREALRDFPEMELRVESSLSGADKAHAIAECDALVLPTLSENFGLVVAEALAAGKPVVTTKAAPWQGIVERRCGWWVEPTVDGLRAAIGEFRSTSRKELVAMGARGRQWMGESFRWPDRAAALDRMIAGGRRDPKGARSAG